MSQSESPEPERDKLRPCVPLPVVLLWTVKNTSVDDALEQIVWGMVGAETVTRGLTHAYRAGTTAVMHKSCSVGKVKPSHWRATEAQVQPLAAYLRSSRWPVAQASEKYILIQPKPGNTNSTPFTVSLYIRHTAIILSTCYAMK